MMKRNKWKIVIVLVFIAGLSVLLYPNFSNYWNSKSQSKVVASYNDALKEIPQEDYEGMLKKAESYKTIKRLLEQNGYERHKDKYFTFVKTIVINGISPVNPSSIISV